MKLTQYVDEIRKMIYRSFDNQFQRMGFNKKEYNNAKNERIKEIITNHIGETKSYENAREKVLDELSFTLFNRISAIKVMEAHTLFPEIITKRHSNGDRSFGHKRWLEQNPQMRNEDLDGIREYLKFAFNKLGDDIPLYHKNYPYALLPYVIELNEIIDLFNKIETDKDIENDIWQNDDILGWLYESYNNAKKKEFKESKTKTEYDKVSLQSQVYTPRWVVEFLVNNSLGKLYLEMFPDSEIKDKYKIANAPQKRIRDRKPLREIKLIDPACGSGNFLLYAFILFYELYIDQIENYGADYDEDDIPKLIIENNLFGVDLDDRAIQIAQLGLFIKAKQKYNSIHIEKFNIISSDFYLPDYSEVKNIFEDGQDLQKDEKDIIEDIWTDLQSAHKFGSLIRLEEKLDIKLHGIIDSVKGFTIRIFAEQEVEKYHKFRKNFFVNLQKAIKQFTAKKGETFLTSKTADAVSFLNIISQKYEVATANPPYTDSSDFGKELKKFIDANYKNPYKFHTNLYATFIKRCHEITTVDGKMALIHPRTFMFIKSFEDVRRFILEKSHINLFVDYSLSNLFGSIMVDPAFYVLEKSIKSYEKSMFVSLDQYTRTPKEKLKKEFCLNALDNYISQSKDENIYTIPQSKLKIIKSYPFIYWISDEFREKFEGTAVKDLLKNCQGLATANNNRFLRFWWEITKKNISSDYSEDRLKWILYSKGGPFNKWLGNLWLTVNWENKGIEIKNFCDANGKQRSRPQNEEYYLEEGVTYSASGSKGSSYRIFPKNSLFDVGGSCIFAKGKYSNNWYVLTFFNSNLSKYIVESLNPTVNKQVGDIERIPFLIPQKSDEKQLSNLGKTNVEIKKHLTEFSLIEIDFKQSPVQFTAKNDIKSNIQSYLNYENYLLTKILINEAIIDEKVFEIYELTAKDKEMVLAKEGKSIGGLAVSSNAKRAFIQNFGMSDRSSECSSTTSQPENSTFRRADAHSEVDEFIKNLEVKDFSDEKRDEIIGKLSTLYKSNNNLEEFCKKEQINPINIWYWFQENNIFPAHRVKDIGMEFLADIIREILNEDEDGIVPLVRHTGEEILLDRIEKKFYQKGFSSAQYSSFDKIIGKPLNEYIENNFFKDFSDHLNLFMYLPKTPFIWHISSGKYRAVEVFIIIYKWNRDKLQKIKSVYVENREQSLINRQMDLSENKTAAAQTEKDLIYYQLQEIEEFKAKIDELLSENYNPILDDGVGKNIAPLQKKKMITYEVLNKGQLKKYLNADW